MAKTVVQQVILSTNHSDLSSSTFSRNVTPVRIAPQMPTRSRDIRQIFGQGLVKELELHFSKDIATKLLPILVKHIAKESANYNGDKQSPQEFVQAVTEKFCHKRIMPVDPHGYKLQEEFERLIKSMVNKAFYNAELREDVFQEILLQLSTTTHKYDPTRASTTTWVMLLTKRKIIDTLRRAAHRSKTDGKEFNEEVYNPGEKASLCQLRDDFTYVMQHPAMRSLPEIQKDILKLTYLKGRTLRQISEDLNMNLGTVKSALSRALGTLRRQVVDPSKL